MVWRTSFLVAFVLYLAAACTASAVEVAGLYRAEAVVTGREEPERSRGLREALEEVLGKLTAVLELPRGEALEAALADPAAYVAAYEYEDRKKGIPIHDEQGTRDRSYILRVTFDQAKVDRLVSDLGLTLWPADRHRLAILLSVHDGERAFLLTSDGERGFGQREVLLSAAARKGLPVVMPSEVERVAGKLEPGVISLPDTDITRIARDLGADGALAGELRLAGDGATWHVHWMLHGLKVQGEWRMENVSFDVALAAGVSRAARALAEVQAASPAAQKQ